MQVFSHTGFDPTVLQTRSEWPHSVAADTLCVCPLDWVSRSCINCIEMLRFLHASHTGEGVPHDCMGVWADW